MLPIEHYWYRFVFLNFILWTLMECLHFFKSAKFSSRKIHVLCKVEKNKGNCGIQPTPSSLTKDRPNPNKNPNPSVHKQDLNSAVCYCGLYSAIVPKNIIFRNKTLNTSNVQRLNFKACVCNPTPKMMPRSAIICTPKFWFPEDSDCKKMG